MIVVDTNVISEILRLRPAAQVIEWFHSHRNPTLFTTAITEAELLYGVALLPEGRKRRSLAELIERMLPYELGARTSLEWPEDGIRVRLLIPARAGVPVWRAV